MRITIPELALVALIGASGSGKSTFARRHFLPTEVLSSDHCRALVSDDENSQAATQDAFDVLNYIARKRLAAGRLTVVDATNVRAEDRKKLIDLAREFHCLPVAIVLDPPVGVCIDRNRERPERDFGSHVVHNQHKQLKSSLRQLKREGFRHVFALDSVAEIDAVEIERQPLWNNRRNEQGPFDIIGDVHGCYCELVELLNALGYTVQQDPTKPRGDCTVIPPATGDDKGPRRLVFLGDLVDRGPDSPAVLRLVMRLCAEGQALCVPGNHDIKLYRHLKGEHVKPTHGLECTLEQLAHEPPEFRQQVSEFIYSLVSHYVFHGGRLVVAHAGMREEMQGRGSSRVRDFALFGETTGETDEYGLPVRYNWASEYRGQAVVVYGHTPVPEPQWLNATINIDTGCVFGGRLTALRYPELQLVFVPARETYAQPARPISQTYLAAGDLSHQQEHDALLRIEDALGKRLIDARLAPKIIIREEQASAALEVMSRFAIDPRWLIYLPPTMSPPPVSDLPELLEHPSDVFQYYRKVHAGTVVCEEKHMGSRAVVALCRDADSARRRFGVDTGEHGACYTRTGRRYFDDAQLEQQFLQRIADAAEACGFWTRHGTDWLCLDCELMPWSHKAQGLLEEQYAKTGSAACAALNATREALMQAASREIEGAPELAALLERTVQRTAAVADYVVAYRRYCWPVRSIDDLKLAPFHILAWEDAVHVDKDHLWHLNTIAELCGSGDPLLQRTAHQVVDLDDATSVQGGIDWWLELTRRGGEGMVVKPLQFVLPQGEGLAQPAVKCRGREYLRIIYGPEYTLPDNIRRLRTRSLGRKRALAEKEFALGIEALERFVRRESLRRVHECVCAVLALESEPTDPRL
jgi:protein phosphatase